jgi:hypothetical protein
MDFRSFLNWLSIALQFIAGGSFVIWPDQKWIGLVFILVGMAIALGSGGIFISQKKEIFRNLQGSWFLLPIGMSLGLLFVWGFGLFLYDPNEYAIKDKTKLEVVTGQTFKMSMWLLMVEHSTETSSITLLSFMMAQLPFR